jgi:signal transduction histidine kinase/ActR/RegA family two-component response regulator
MEEKTGYALVAQERAQTLLVRLALAAFLGVTAAVVSPSWWPAYWFIAVCFGQGLDYLVLRPFRRDPTDRRSAAYRAMCCVVIFLNTALYAATSFYLWRTGGDIGKAFAMIQACGGLLHVSLHMRRERSLLIAAGLAHILYLLGLPALELVSTRPLAILMATLGGVYFISQLSIAVRQANAETLALETARAEAERASLAKTEFLTTISHEIRTPMNAVVSAGFLLKRTSLTQEQMNHLSMLTHASDVLLGLLNDVLDLSRIEGGKLAITNADLDLHDLLNALVALWRPQIVEKGCLLYLDLDPKVPQAIRADPLRLRQILFNLLSNAVKFTDRGHVTLRVRLGGEGRLCFEVEDTGCGIPEAALPRLFQSFEQVDSSTTRRHGGSGLGLAISRNLAQLMGGTLTVTSQLGLGSVFRLDLPLLPILGPQFSHDRRRLAREPLSSEPLPKWLEPMTVLVAEDHEVNRKIIGLFLDPIGCEVAFAVNGQEAVDLAMARPFDVIFLDMQMPIMDGLEAARIIRSGGLNAKSPIIAITANVLMSHRLAWSEVGADAFLAKPIDPNLLVATLKQVINSQEDAEPSQISIP